MRHEQGPVHRAGGAGHPVPGAPGVVSRPADQTGPGDDETVADRRAHRRLAGDLGLPVLLPPRVLLLGGRQERGRLVGADRAVVGVRADGRDVRPVPGPLRQCHERVADERRLPRHLQHGVPVAVHEPGVGGPVRPVRRHQPCTGGDFTALAARQAGHVVSARHRLPRDLTAQPRGPAQYQKIHPATPAHRRRDRDPGSRSAKDRSQGVPPRLTGRAACTRGATGPGRGPSRARGSPAGRE